MTHNMIACVLCASHVLAFALGVGMRACGENEARLPQVIGGSLLLAAITFAVALLMWGAVTLLG